MLDTVVLLLLFVGRLDPKYIKKFEPTHQYSIEDYELLEKIIRPFKKVVITPHVISELSNHTLQCIENDKLHYYFSIVTNFLTNKDKAEERHLRFDEWQDRGIPRLCSFGFVDLSIYEISKSKKLAVLTDDIKFYNLSKKDIPIIKLSILKYSNTKFA